MSTYSIKSITVLLTLSLLLVACGGSSGSSSSTPSDQNNTATVLIPAPTAKYPVASSPVIIDNNLVNPAIDYWKGKIINGTRYSMNDIIKKGSETIVFPVAVPHNEIYGSVQDNNLSFIAYLLHPTSLQNTDPDADVQGHIFPKMRPEGSPAKFPNASQQYPLVVYSHGSYDNPVAEIELLSNLAMQGYIVMAIWHCDGIYTEDSPEQLSMRPLEMKKAIDYILQDPVYGKYIDQSKIAAMGQSLGGLSVAGLVGAKLINFARSEAENKLVWMDVENDHRVKAAIGTVPYFGGVDTYGYTTADTKNVFAPYIALAAADDNDADYNLIKSNMQSITNVDRYLVKFNGYGHDLVDAVTAHDIIGWSDVFLDSYLDNNTTSKTLLTKAQSVEGYADDHQVDLTK